MAAEGAGSEGGGGGGFDTQGAITAVIKIAVNYVAQKQQAKEQLKLQERLESLSLEQQKQLAIRLQDAQSDIEKTKILYQSLALERNREALLKMNINRYRGIAILGIGFVILAGVIIKVKNQQNG